MLNSRFANSMAERFADRIVKPATAGVDDQIRSAYLIACNRLPTESEVKQVGEFLTSQASRYRDAGAAPSAATTSALVDFCQVLLASNEFLYVR